MRSYVVIYATSSNVWGWSYRHFRSPRALVRFLKCAGDEVRKIHSVELAVQR